MHFLSAPSAAPNAVMLITITDTTITVQWEEVECIGRNGEITGYSVKYSGGDSAQTVTVTEREVTIQDLMSSTPYSIKVAAMTRAGTGPYSIPVNEETKGTIQLYKVLH